MITPRPIRIGTRKSALAIVQARQAAAAMNLGTNYELVSIVSSGDKIAGSLQAHGGKSLFTKELDSALLKGEIDLAVHSMKDVETPLPEGLGIAAIPLRMDVRDVLIINPEISLEAAKKLTIGTSSLRRAHQLMFHYPNISAVPCRGNIQTRLQKYTNGDFDGIILALAGLQRMGIFHKNSIDGINANIKILDPYSFVPAPGQGALAIVKRTSDTCFDECLKKANHQNSFLAVQIERKITEALNLSCHDAVGVYAQIEEALLSVYVQLFEKQGLIEKKVQGRLKDHENIVKNLISELSQLRRSSPIADPA